MSLAEDTNAGRGSDNARRVGSGTDTVLSTRSPYALIGRLDANRGSSRVAVRHREDLVRAATRQGQWDGDRRADRERVAARRDRDTRAGLERDGVRQAVHALDHLPVWDLR